MSKETIDIFRGAALIVASFFVPTGWAAVFRYVGTSMTLQGVGRALTPVPKRPINSVKGSAMGGTNAMALLFGTRRIGGQLVYINTAGAQKTDLYIVMAHSLAHPGGCEGIGGVWVDSTFIDGANINPTTGVVSAGVYAGWVEVYVHRGTDDQTVDTHLNGTWPEIDSNFRGRGVFYTVLKAIRDLDDDKTFQKLFSRGIPQYNVLGKGLRCYDPRLDTSRGGSGAHRTNDYDTWAYSENPFVQAGTYAIMVETDGGCGKDPDVDIDWASIMAAANIADESRTVPSHGSPPTTTQPRYESHLVLSLDDDPASNLTKLMATAAGAWVSSGGQLKFYAGAYSAPTDTVDYSWLRGGHRFTPLVDLDGLYNAVKCSYDNEAQDYRTEYATPWTNAAYEAEDGPAGSPRHLPRNEQLFGTTNEYQAQRLQAIMGKRSRAQRAWRLPLNVRGLDLQPWQVVTLDLPDEGINEVVRIVGWEWTAYGPDVVVMQESADYYDDTASGEYTPKSEPDQQAPVYEVPPTPTTVTATGTDNAIVLTWDPLPVDCVAVVYRSNTSGGTYAQVPGGEVQGTNFVDSVTGGTTRYYKVKARRRDDYGAYSSEVSATAKTVADGATAGADWSTNVTSRPTELTDGRVSAGLDSSGDLNRNLTTTRANSSNLLRRTSGGLFSGDLDATLGAAWGTNLTGRPTELTDGRVSTALNASGQLASSTTSGALIDGTAASTVRSRANDGWNLTQAASGVRVGDQRNMVAAGTLNRISFQSTTTPVTGGRDFLDPDYEYWIRVNAHTLYGGGLSFSMPETYVYALSANTDYYAYSELPTYDFTSPTVSVGTNAEDILADKDYVYFGKGHTPTTGGSGGGGVGGGGNTQPP